MKLLDKYVAKTVLSAIALVTLMLAGLQVFILFVNQLDDLGRADYGLLEAAVFVFLQMPYQVYLFFPMASLLGCLVGLGIMANHSELVVMRAAGMSIGQITRAVMKASLLLVVIVTVPGESLVPKMAYYANDYKMSKLTGGQAMRTAQGVWLRNKSDFISIYRVLPSRELLNVNQYRFDNDHQLRIARFIRKVVYENNQWQAYDVSETRFVGNDKTEVKKIDKMLWPVDVQPKVLGISGSEPDELTLKELYHYLKAQKQNRIAATGYRLAFWQRLVQPLTTMVMMLLAIPFIFGPLRSSTMGSKFLIGATVGFGFYIVNRFFGPVSMVYQFPPELAAIGPTVIFALLGLYLMKKVQ